MLIDVSLQWPQGHRSSITKSEWFSMMKHIWTVSQPYLSAFWWKNKKFLLSMNCCCYTLSHIFHSFKNCYFYLLYVCIPTCACAIYTYVSLKLFTLLDFPSHLSVLLQYHKSCAVKMEVLSQLLEQVSHSQHLLPVADTNEPDSASSDWVSLVIDGRHHY